jgi:hypothetical protein
MGLEVLESVSCIFVGFVVGCDDALGHDLHVIFVEIFRDAFYDYTDVNGIRSFGAHEGASDGAKIEVSEDDSRESGDDKGAELHG